MAVTGTGFGRIRSLPEDRLTHVNNWLQRGGEVMTLTRHVQQEWKLWTDVNERTLCQQLNRYKIWLLSQSSPDIPALVTKAGAMVVKATRTRNIDVLERMVNLVTIQERRLQMFLDQEATIKMPLAGVEKVMDSTMSMLKDIQKVRFDLGMDDYQGPVAGGQIMRAASKTTTTSPDGTVTSQSTLFEAVALADQILHRARVPDNLKILGREIDGPETAA